tara:strand:- start:167 stop:547 length:381 start_codon:yes stop_codon:yes gene_type:complete
MSFIRNPRQPTQEHLEYYYQQVLLPKYDKDNLVSVDLGGGKSYKLPELSFDTRTLKPDKTFERGGLKWNPQEMFLRQNETSAFREYADKYKETNVEARREAVKKIPNLEFSLKPVQLIKPRYGKII